jgi:alpha-glucosidase (family GH31 glycosyl hydrolase)
MVNPILFMCVKASLLVLLFAVSLCPCVSLKRHFVIPDGNPTASPKAVVQVKNVRFTVLTPALIRIEKILPNGSFEDRQTMVVFNRRLPVPWFSTKTLGLNGGVEITTEDLVLTYLGSADETFSPSNLFIQMKTENYNNMSKWKYGDSSEGNLFGTFRTYDTLRGFQDLNCSRHKPWVTTSEPEHCAFGFISRSGFAIFDDSRSPLLYDGWVHPNVNGQCAADYTKPCFGADFNPGGLRTANKTACVLAGCCWQGHEASDLVDVAWYSDGTENVLTTLDFPLPSGYKVVNSVFNGPPVGQLYRQNKEKDLYPFKLWRKNESINSSSLRHYTTASIEGEKDAIANKFAFVGILGYIAKVQTKRATQELKLYYDKAADDHFSSIDNCQSCFEKNYTFLRIQGFLFPTANLCTMKSGNEDFYFFGHGKNYQGALFDFSLIAGKIPIPRRHMMGISWSRWATGAEEWNGNQTLQHNAAVSLSESGFPLDTFVFDMNWHEKPTWTGYSWDRKMYPNPQELLSFLHDRGLYVGANLHDAQGVMNDEDEYKSMASFVNQSDGKTITFHVSNQAYADGLHQTVLEPLAKNGGFDFFWIDWQQGLQGQPGVGTTDITGLNPTAWLNHYRTMNYTRPGSKRRPQIHSRFGGLGGHRYTTQFGGDVVQAWDSLLAMIYTTAISTNVLVSHWAQEIMQVVGEHELFTRVAQFGSWGPIFTIWGNRYRPCNLWSDGDFPQPYREAVRVSLLQRSMLIPYRYTLAAIAHDKALGMLRPMYYDYPSNENAYSGHYNSLPQYMLGDSILVAPPYTELQISTNLTSNAKPYGIWLPTDVAWVPLFNTSVHLPTVNASGWGQVSPLLHQVPAFVKAGSMIPMLPDHLAILPGSASRSFSNLEWWVFPTSPGDKSRKVAWCYEDDGLSLDYIRKKKAFVNMTIMKGQESLIEDRIVKYVLSQSGDYDTAPQERTLSLRLVGRNSTSIESIEVDGLNLQKLKIPSCDASTSGSTKPFYCDGTNGNRSFVLIWLGSGAVSADRTVTVKSV